MATLIDVLDNFTGEALTEKEFLNWARSHRDKLPELWSEIQRFLEVADMQADNCSISLALGVDVGYKWIKETDSIPGIVSALLLYYPRVALALPPITTNEYGPEFLTMILTPYMRLRPLVEKGVVLAWQREGHNEEISDKIHIVLTYLLRKKSFIETVEAMRNRVFSETWLSWWPNWRSREPGLLAWHFFSFMLDRFGECSRKGLCPAPQSYSEWMTLKESLRLLSAPISDKTGLEFSFATMCDNISLPQVNQLKPRDMIAIRQSEEAFAFWRDAVLKASRRIQTPGLPVHNDFGQEIREVLLGKAAAVQDSIMNTRLRDKFATGAITFSLSATTIAATSGLGVGNIQEEMAKWGISAAVAAIAVLLFGRTAPSKEALRRHIAAFCEEDRSELRK